MRLGIVALLAAVACGTTSKNNEMGQPAAGGGGAQGRGGAQGGGAQGGGSTQGGRGQGGGALAAGSAGDTQSKPDPPCPASRLTTDPCELPAQVCTYPDPQSCTPMDAHWNLTCKEGKWETSYSGPFDCPQFPPAGGGSADGSASGDGAAGDAEPGGAATGGAAH